jgi:hypothetical protein
MSVSDCLILRISERTDTWIDTLTRIENTLYVIFDCNKREFLVRGVVNNVSCSFMCKRAKSMSDFIDIISVPESTLYYTLYNYPDLSQTSDEITYENLDEYVSDEYEIVSEKTNKDISVYNILLMLKNMFNYY